MDSYQNLTSQGRNAYLNALDKINWFDYSKVSREIVKERLSEIENSIEYMSSLYDFCFDAEGFEDNSMYQTFLTEVFQTLKLPLESDCQGDFENILITVMGEKSYQYSLEIQSDWIDDDLIDEFLNNEVLPSEGIENQLLALPPFDQLVQLVFVPKEIYEMAVREGIIPNNEGYFFENEY